MILNVNRQQPVPVQSVNGHTGAVELDAADVGAATAESVAELSTAIGDIGTLLFSIVGCA